MLFKSNSKTLVFPTLFFRFLNTRVYQEVGDVGLFLFNDALLVATLTFKFVPFSRLVQRNYKYVFFRGEGLHEIKHRKDSVLLQLFILAWILLNKQEHLVEHKLQV